MNYTNQLTELNNVKDTLTKELFSLQGRYYGLGEEIEIAEFRIKEITNKKLIYSKSIEFLRKVEEVTKNTLISGFESLISMSMRSICQDDYGFKFLFKKRGNTQELHYLIKTPDCQEFHDIITTQAGGILDVVSVSLRIALLEKLKLGGILAFDESFKALSRNYLDNAGKFLKKIHNRTNRQLLLVTHREELANYADNKINLNKEVNNG